jgi:hypothetical protein
VIIHIVAHHDTISEPPTADTPQDPDAPDDSPVPDGANDSDDAPVPDDADSPDDHDGQAVPDEAGSAGSPAATDRAADECASLDGLPPPMFSKPLRELTWADLAKPDPGHLACLRPAAMMGGQFLPGAITRRAALGATVSVILHPGLAPPEPHYTPSKALADFVRSRDLTCRFPGCKQPATTCDLDHSIPWPYGPTQASNLKSLCRKHHLLKTFWAGEGGWRDRQLPDGTVIWTAADGQTYTTTPGSRLLFPELCQPTAPVIPVDVPTQPAHTAGLRMPRRKTTRTQDRARRIQYERELNRTAAEAEAEAAAGVKPAAPDTTPPFARPDTANRHRPVDIAHTRGQVRCG